jgi:hypothetical protein
VESGDSRTTHRTYPSHARSLKLPLPPPETAKKLATALALAAEALRGISTVR